MRKGAWLLIIVALVLAVGCAEAPEVREVRPITNTNTQFTIEVSGTQGLQYQGSHMVVTSNGGSASESVSGTVPSRYSVRGVIASAAFQKQSQSGTLTVEIFEGGERVAYSTTRAPYGMVSVSASWE